MTNTKQATRRQLRYETLNDIVADAERLVEADAPTTGNWSKGQIFRHLATVMNKCVDGFENMANPVLRGMLRLAFKKRFMSRTVPAGHRLTGAIAEELLPAPIADDEGLESLRKAVARLQLDSSREPHPFLGTLSREEWDQIHCRHSELHMSFIAEPRTGR